MTAAIGLRDHTGWAALVALSGNADDPVVLDRRRLVLCPPDEPRQPYHAAQGMSVDEAAALVERIAATASRLATEAFAAIAGDHDVVAAGIPVSTMTPPDDLAAVLGSHTLLHAAEGVLYREALLDGAEACGLPVVGVEVKRLYGDLAARLGRTEDDVRGALGALGAGLGPPWRAEQKEAAAAAWMALLT